MKKQFIFFNQYSGSYTRSKAESIINLLKASGIDAEALLPESEKDATILAGRLCREHDNPTLIAAGGDGTFNTLLNGIGEEKAALAAIPLGTANVIGCELGIRSVEDAVARISRGDKKPLNAGIVTCGEMKKRFFLMAGIGFDGAVVCGVRSCEKKRFGKGAYILSVFRELKLYDKSPIMLEYGDKSSEAHSVIITNSKHYGGNFVISQESAIHEPSLEIIPLETYSKKSLLKMTLSLLLTGKLNKVENSFIMNSGFLSVCGNKRCQIDGDPFISGDFKVSLDKLAADIII